MNRFEIFKFNKYLYYVVLIEWNLLFLFMSHDILVLNFCFATDDMYWNIMKNFFCLSCGVSVMAWRLVFSVCILWQFLLNFLWALIN